VENGSNPGARRLVGTTLAAEANTMRVIIEGLGEDRALRTLVNGKIAASLGRLHVPATTARVQFGNETGAKGGPTARCSITVDLPRRPELHADVTGESTRLAFEQAFAMLERQIERDRARGREERRRPKKYYLAKRLLEPGASSQEPPARSAAGRRLARRRTA
jgi:ribosome-associated translation inhibitor RaiA